MNIKQMLVIIKFSFFTYCMQETHDLKNDKIIEIINNKFPNISKENLEKILYLLPKNFKQNDEKENIQFIINKIEEINTSIFKKYNTLDDNQKIEIIIKNIKIILKFICDNNYLFNQYNEENEKLPKLSIKNITKLDCLLDCTKEINNELRIFTTEIEELIENLQKYLKIMNNEKYSNVTIKELKQYINQVDKNTPIKEISHFNKLNLLKQIIYEITKYLKYDYDSKMTLNKKKLNEETNKKKLNEETNHQNTENFIIYIFNQLMDNKDYFVQSNENIVESNKNNIKDALASLIIDKKKPSENLLTRVAKLLLKIQYKTIPQKNIEMIIYNIKQINKKVLGNDNVNFKQEEVLEMLKYILSIIHYDKLFNYKDTDNLSIQCKIENICTLLQLTEEINQMCFTYEKEKNLEYLKSSLMPRLITYLYFLQKEDRTPTNLGIKFKDSYINKIPIKELDLDTRLLILKSLIELIFYKYLKTGSIDEQHKKIFKKIFNITNITNITNINKNNVKQNIYNHILICFKKTYNPQLSREHYILIEKISNLLSKFIEEEFDDEKYWQNIFKIINENKQFKSLEFLEYFWKILKFIENNKSLFPTDKKTYLEKSFKIINFILKDLKIVNKYFNTEKSIESLLEDYKKYLEIIQKNIGAIKLYQLCFSNELPIQELTPHFQIYMLKLIIKKYYNNKEILKELKEKEKKAIEELFKEIEKTCKSKKNKNMIFKKVIVVLLSIKIFYSYIIENNLNEKNYRIYQDDVLKKIMFTLFVITIYYFYNLYYEKNNEIPVTKEKETNTYNGIISHGTTYNSTYIYAIIIAFLSYLI